MSTHCQSLKAFSHASSMFFHLLFIHLFRPFLKYTRSNSPLPPQVSPRKMCTQAASSISKLFRLYKKTYGLKQICNIAVYIAHSACTIHLLNLPDKDARRDISHGVRHLEEVAECWLCAARTLATLGIQARRWKIELPTDTVSILQKWESKYRSDHALTAVGKISPTIEQAHRVASTKSNTPASSGSRPTDALFARPPSKASTKSTHSEDHETIIPTDVAADFAPAPSIREPQQPRQVGTSQQNVQENWVPATSEIANATIPSATQQQQMRRPSYSSLFPGLETLFEDGKEWWLRDQSAFFDGWGTRRESNNNLTGTPASNGAVSGSLASANGIPDMMDAIQSMSQNLAAANGMHTMTPMNNDVTMNGLGAWEFGAGAGVDQEGFAYENENSTY